MSTNACKSRHQMVLLMEASSRTRRPNTHASCRPHPGSVRMGDPRDHRMTRLGAVWMPVFLDGDILLARVPLGGVKVAGLLRNMS